MDVDGPEPELQFKDAEDWQGGAGYEKITFKGIVLMHFQKISIYQAVEMRGGYWDEKPTKSGFIERTYVPDSRAVYGGAVEYLHDLLIPKFDKEMKAAAAVIEKEIDDEYDKYEKDKEANAERSEALLHSYFNKKMKLSRKLFQELSKLLARLKYLEAGFLTDSI